MARAPRGQNNDPEPEEDDQEPDDDDQEPDEDEGDDDYTPPTKEEWANTQAALKKANTEAKRFRTQLRNTRKETQGESSTDQQAAEDKVIAQWKPRVVRSEARAALASAGAKTHALAKLARMIDLDDVEVDDDGEVSGLDDLIEELKDDLPELFKDDDDDDTPPRRTKRRLGKTDAGARSSNGSKTTQKDSSTRQAEALLGRSR
jgi:minor structural protein GP20